MVPILPRSVGAFYLLWLFSLPASLSAWREPSTSVSLAASQAWRAPMQFGLFSESGYRRHTAPADAFEEDLREIVAADRLGFREAWIAEPNHVRANTVTNASLLMAKAAGLT